MYLNKRAPLPLFTEVNAFAAFYIFSGLTHAFREVRVMALHPINIVHDYTIVKWEGEVFAAWCNVLLCNFESNHVAGCVMEGEGNLTGAWRELLNEEKKGAVIVFFHAKHNETYRCRFIVQDRPASAGGFHKTCLYTQKFAYLICLKYAYRAF